MLRDWMVSTQEGIIFEREIGGESAVCCCDIVPAGGDCLLFSSYQPVKR